MMCGCGWPPQSVDTCQGLCHEGPRYSTLACYSVLCVSLWR